MKIHILGIRGLPSTYSGYETFVGELAPRLAARGHEVTVYCRRALYPERPAEWRGVRLAYLPSLEHKAFSTLSHSCLSFFKASASRPDVILAVNAANGWFAWIPRMYGVPVVVNVDGMEWLRPKWGRAARFMFLRGARLACRFADSVVTDAEEMHRLYAAQFGLDTDYIAYGANIEESRDASCLAARGLESGKYFLVASRLVPDNNADLIIEAFGRVKTEMRLAIAGGADYKGNRTEREFKARLEKLADGRVLFLGHVNNPDEVRELHCNCYAYVHGHQFGGINPSLLKALGFGNMVLALNTPFNSEVLDSGRYGVLFEKNVEDLARKMQQACDSPETAAQLRARARDRIRERFTWDHITGQYETLLERLSGRSHARKGSAGS